MQWAKLLDWAVLGVFCAEAALFVICAIPRRKEKRKWET